MALIAKLLSHVRPYVGCVRVRVGVWECVEVWESVRVPGRIQSVVRVCVCVCVRVREWVHA